MHSDSFYPAWNADGAELGSTNWSMVLAVGDSSIAHANRALTSLCETYWTPLYAFVRRRTGDRQQAEDLTQAFFVHLLEKDMLQTADPGRGRFRAFLLTSLKYFLANEYHKQQAQKRGGGRLPLSLDFQAGECCTSLHAVDRCTPEAIFDRQWAIVLMENAINRLREEYRVGGRQEQLDRFLPFLSCDEGVESCAEASAALGMSENAGYVALHRMRKRFAAILRKLIGDTLEDPANVEDEIQHLFRALAS